MAYVVFHATVDTSEDSASGVFIRHVDGTSISSEAGKERAAIERRHLRLDLCADDRIDLLADMMRNFLENGLNIDREIIVSVRKKICLGNLKITEFPSSCGRKVEREGPRMLMSLGSMVGRSLDYFGLINLEQNLQMTIMTLPRTFAFPTLAWNQRYWMTDFHTDNLSISKASSVNQEFGIHKDSFYTVDPFSSGSFVDFDLREHDSICSVMQDLEVGGCLNFSDGQDPLMDIETALTYHDTKPFNFVVAEESYCLTADNLGFPKQGGSKRSKNVIQCRKGKVRELSSTKMCIMGHKLLTHLAGKYGERKWSTIAQMLKGRIGKQCRQRWHNHLRPDIKKPRKVSLEEQRTLQKEGNSQGEVAGPKWPKPSSLLQNNIKSLDFEKKSSSLPKMNRTPKTIDPEILNNKTSIVKNSEMKFQTKHCQYGFADVPEFTFNDYHLFRGNNMESLLVDIYESVAHLGLTNTNVAMLTFLSNVDSFDGNILLHDFAMPLFIFET
ncbi:myb domain protein 98, partial [Striga asiatica]